MLCCWCGALAGRAQTIAVPLGQAANFGLLSGGSITADTLVGVSVRGAVGANGSITGHVTASGGLYRPSGPTATGALLDLAAAKSYCDSLNGQALNGTLGGVSLTPGVYTISGNATLAANTVLALTGDATGVYIFNITGDLNIGANAGLAAGWVSSKHIYWNVAGKVKIVGNVGWQGLVLGGDSISLTGEKSGTFALLTTGAGVKVAGMQTHPGDNQLFASVVLGATPWRECGSTAQPANLAPNPSFEDAFVPPSGRMNMYPFFSQACWWYQATLGTADYFKANATSGEVGVPSNCYGTQPSRMFTNGPQTDAYAGIWMSNAYTVPPQPTFEYLEAPTTEPLQAGKAYYCGFFWNRAGSSNLAVRHLGICLSSVSTRLPGTTTTTFLYDPTILPGAVWVADDRTTTNGILLNPAADPHAWSHIGGIVTPTQDLDMITIGSFKDDGLFPLTSTGNPTNCTGNSFSQAYYYVDDVVVWPLPEMAPTATVCPGRNTIIGLAVPVEIPLGLNVSYQWNTVSGTTYTPIAVNGNQPQLSVTVPGQYALVMTIEGTPYTCPVVTVSAGQGPTLTVTSPNAFQLCVANPQSSVTVTVTGGIPSYELTGPGVTTPIPSSTGTFTFTPPPTAGTYTYTITDGATSGCAGMATVTVTVAAPTVTIQGNPLICPNGSTLLTASGLTSYTWTGPAVTTGNMHAASISVSSTSIIDQVQGDLYTVTGTDASGCTGTASVRVKNYFDYPNGGTVGSTGSDAFPTSISRNMRIRGTITVPAGQTLEIEDVVLEFADSRAPNANVYTRILVKKGAVVNGIQQPGGILRITNATLQPLATSACETAKMWDGIVVEGSPGDPQEVQPGKPIIKQGKVVLAGVTIKDARYGVLAGTAIYQTNPARLVKSVSASGGGIVIGNHATFENCYNGVYFAQYTPLSGQSINVSYFNDCFFRGTKLLEDTDYKSPYSSALRTGMAVGLSLNDVTGIKFKACTFQGFRTPRHYERGIGIGGTNASANISCANYSTDPAQFSTFPNEGCVSGANSFSGWYMGVYFANSTSQAALTLKGNVFADNWRGAVLNNTYNSYVRGNTFTVGTTNDGGSADPGDQSGLFIQSCSGFEPEANTFYQGSGANSHGLVISKTFTHKFNAQGQPNGVEGTDITPKRNRFVSDANLSVKLYSGVYAQYDNMKLQLRCNRFEGLISNADVRVLGDIYANDAAQTKYGIPDQGDCLHGAFGTANNTFSLPANQTTIPSLRLWTNAPGFVYNYASDYPAPRVAGTSGQSITPNNCGFSANNQGCPVTQDHDRPTLRAQLASLTTPAEREPVINALLRSYLNDTLISHGPDSALALLQAENNPAYQSQLTQLLVRTGQYGGSSSRMAAPAAKLRGKWHGETAAGRVAPADYYQRVVELLVPLGTDSARTVALATDATLRAELVAMAEDSLAWGSQAARVALNQYGGTHYVEWIGAEPAATDDDTPSAGRGAPTSPAALYLLPNPSAGPLQVDYTLPTGTRQAALVLYDSWGQQVARYELTAEATRREISLQLRPGLYQVVLRADGQATAQARLLLE